MLSYQHAYHADNFADSHKHAALCIMLEAMMKKPNPLSYFETHAGRGLYDLQGVEAQKTKEHESSLLYPKPVDAPASLKGYYAARHDFAPLFPGSCALAAHLLRAGDTAFLCEAHPQEFQALTEALNSPVISHHKSDGHAAIVSLLARGHKRGFVLIDPSYEVKDEYARVVDTVDDIVARRPDFTVLIWYPVLVGRDYHETLLHGLGLLENDKIWHHELNAPATYRARHPKGLEKSGLYCVNTPFTAQDELTALSNWLETRTK